jgi:CheY-like chemotaxis protein
MNNKLISIILADDDEADRLLFIEALSELKINTSVETVTNGDELMHFLKDHTSHLPHLIFLDLNMPRKNGLQCLQEIRSNQLFQKISVAIYSTSSSNKDIEDTFRHGANIYITKPSDFSKLKKVLEKAVMMTFAYRNESMNWENFILKI